MFKWWVCNWRVSSQACQQPCSHCFFKQKSLSSFLKKQFDCSLFNHFQICSLDQPVQNNEDQVPCSLPVTWFKLTPDKWSGCYKSDSITTQSGCSGDFVSHNLLKHFLSFDTMKTLSSVIWLTMFINLIYGLIIDLVWINHRKLY